MLQVGLCQNDMCRAAPRWRATGNEIGIAQQSCALGSDSCTCISSLCVLSCGQKKHAIEVLGRNLTSAVFSRCIWMSMFDFNFNACHTLKMPQECFLTKGLFFARSPVQRIPRVSRALTARAKKTWRYCG